MQQCMQATKNMKRLWQSIVCRVESNTGRSQLLKEISHSPLSLAEHRTSYIARSRPPPYLGGRGGG